MFASFAEFPKILTLGSKPLHPFHSLVPLFQLHDKKIFLRKLWEAAIFFLFKFKKYSTHRKPRRPCSKLLNSRLDPFHCWFDTCRGLCHWPPACLFSDECQNIFYPLDRVPWRKKKYEVKISWRFFSLIVAHKYAVGRSLGKFGFKYSPQYQ